MTERLRQIVRCMDELEKARKDREAQPNVPAVTWGCMISEMDWLDELHARLYC